MSADVAKTVRTVAGPPVLYYLAIDGTDAQDAATFGALLEGRGWKNLASIYLKPAPDDPTRLVDPAHPFLPIPLVEARGKQIAVVSPNGTNGKGLDRFWMNYSAEVRGRGGLARGRYAAAELSGEYMRRLILTPAIHTHELTPDYLSWHLADRQWPYSSPYAPAARILYVSSHGWLSGRMEGNLLEKAPAAWPQEVREFYNPVERYFNLGQIARTGWGFHGPQWIVLAQCSTLNSAAWQLWGRILGRSSPAVRGILAYEEVSPAALPAAEIADKFFSKLDHGASFLDAWVGANRGQRWAAIVHDDARNDTLRDFPRFHELRDVEFSKTRSRYRGYLESLGRNGVRFKDEEPPLDLAIDHNVGGVFDPVVPEALGTAVSQYSGNDRYRLIVRAPEGSLLRKVKLTVVHIRLSYPRQFNWDALFTLLPSDGTPSGLGSPTLTVSFPQERPSITLNVQARARAPEGLAQNHAYLWFRVEAHTDVGVLRHDFKLLGLEY